MSTLSKSTNHECLDAFVVAMEDLLDMAHHCHFVLIGLKRTQFLALFMCDQSKHTSSCYTWSWVRGKCSLWVKGPRYEEGLHLVGSRGSYTRDFLGKGREFKDTS